MTDKEKIEFLLDVLKEINPTYDIGNNQCIYLADWGDTFEAVEKFFTEYMKFRGEDYDI